MNTENETLVATQLAQQLEEKKENAALVDFKMVTFSLADKDYSIDIMHVKEIAKAGRFTFVPNTLPFVLGVYNLRGEIIPILDLRIFFNIEVPPRDENKLENMLILQVEDQKFGVVVDKIDKVIGVQKSSIQPPHPLFGDINIKYIDGVVESNNRLYVLLDITRIFSSKEVAEAPVPGVNFEKPQRIVKQPPKAAPVPKAQAAAVAEGGMVKSPADIARGITGGDASTEEDASSVDIKFISESLLTYKNFTVSSVNSTWIKHRYSEWSKETKKNQLQTSDDADSFLKTFWSPFTNNWWSKEYADAVFKVLPDNAAKQIVVWNPGCGKGTETYSLACVLKKRYPDAKIRIFAQDIDLLNVSNAGLMSVPANLASDWYSPYLTKKANGEYTFSQEIKDSIMFEYHDCKHTNALPAVDIIFARDILSLLDEKAQESVVNDFIEKMKGNAVAIIGENEEMPDSFSFGENAVGTLVAYTKD
ncbi:MAG: CheR family methyltransferase [Treponema sp.]|nr:chemotaxis protein CheW [Spirochaetia bacterium]MDD7534459.1 chemotaxis protein CheW [Treponema sp.]MDY3721673.1 CheR family methyltransferase [Treponema sp.]MDY5757641.1 CheR family methyltransferase [Treponema sp.]MDY5819218.1 CheR family methyltransferase [Treponema sp.]